MGFEWHGHNDLHKVQINAATAWLYGCSAANAAIFGIGERTGNPPLEALVVEHAQLKGHTPAVDYAAITELYEYARDELGFEIPNNYPLTGKDFNVTRAGIHADGLLKNEEIYNCFDTKKLLNRPVSVAITDKTGAAGIKHWTESTPSTRPTGYRRYQTRKCFNGPAKLLAVIYRHRGESIGK